MVEEYCEEPFNFGECEECTIPCPVNCSGWATPSHMVNVSFLRNGRQRQIYIPELLYKTRTDDPNAASVITINFSFMYDDDVKKFVGENEINFGTYGFNALEDTHRQVIAPLKGDVKPDSKTIVIEVADNESGKFFPIIVGGGALGAVSTTITYEIFENDPDSQEPPIKEVDTGEDEVISASKENQGENEDDEENTIFADKD